VPETVADPLTERSAAFCAGSPARHQRTLELIVPGFNGVEGPAIAEVLGRMGMHGGESPRAAFSSGSHPSQEVHVDPVAIKCALRKNGMPCVWSQCRWLSRERAAERLAAYSASVLLQSGARIQHDRRRLTGMG